LASVRKPLTFNKIHFRTPWIHPEFRYNLKRLKQLELLEKEQLYDENLIISSAERGIRTFS
jgi:hypothetical protein